MVLYRRVVGPTCHAHAQAVDEDILDRFTLGSADGPALTAVVFGGAAYYLLGPGCAEGQLGPWARYRAGQALVLTDHHDLRVGEHEGRRPVFDARL